MQFKNPARITYKLKPPIQLEGYMPTVDSADLEKLRVDYYIAATNLDVPGDVYDGTGGAGIISSRVCQD